MPGRVARRADDLQAADAVAGLETHVRRRFEVRPGARQLPLHGLLPCVDAGIELGHRDLQLAVEPAAQLVQRADMVAVPVRERDAPDRRARLRRGVEQRASTAWDGGVDEREAVVLPHEEGVNEAQPRELENGRSELTRAHGGRKVRPSPARGGSKQMMLALAASSVLLT